MATLYLVTHRPTGAKFLVLPDEAVDGYTWAVFEATSVSRVPLDAEDCDVQTIEVPEGSSGWAVQL